MSKKYLSIEEAAEQLGVSTTELNRLREKGQIRAFADRGTWKFKEEDVETLARSRQADSNPDVPLMPADESSVMDDEDVLGSQPTVIRKGASDDSSDSDVRLIFDESMKVEEPGAAPLLDDSDSDVKLAPSAAGTPDSDSDVKLAGTKPGSFDTGSDSDVKLVTDDLPVADTSGSDSDVRLVSSDSSGEVKMTGSSGDVVPVAGDDDSAVGVDSAESSAIGGDSGISLGEGSGIALASDSGISLEQPNDSGISLSGEASILLEADSGISLAAEMPLKSDSGISLAPADSGKKKKAGGKKEATQGDDDLGGTIPLMDAQGAPAEDLLDTQMEVPALSDSSESQDLFGSSTGDSTNVITLDDEEEQAGYDVTADIPVEGSSAVEDEEEVVAEEEEEPVEISDDLVGEDDELTEDVFGAEDEDFAADDLESGESSSELPVAPRGMVAVAEQEWGTGVHVMLVCSTLLTVLCGTVVFDMVRNMWHTDAANHNPLATMFVDMLKGM